MRLPFIHRRRPLPKGDRSAKPQGSEPSAPDRGGRFFNELQVEFLVHELKDPIAVIETGVRALLERTDKYGPITEHQQKTLNRILRSTRKTREMLYGLLEVGRSEAGFCICCRFNPVRALYEVLVESLEALPDRLPEGLRSRRRDPASADLLAGVGIRFSAAAEATEATMHQDETKFRQIVGNLIKNGLHHRRQLLDIRIETQEAGMLTVVVADDGPGVDPKHHRLIFERYAQLQECASLERKGHGLGLAGALVMARCLGGEITVDSRKGQGAVFRLTLPLVFAEDSQ